jgi:hypothetical protein
MMMLAHFLLENNRTDVVGVQFRDLPARDSAEALTARMR